MKIKQVLMLLLFHHPDMQPYTLKIKQGLTLLLLGISFGQEALGQNIGQDIPETLIISSDFKLSKVSAPTPLAKNNIQWLRSLQQARQGRDFSQCLSLIQKNRQRIEILAPWLSSYELFCAREWSEKNSKARVRLLRAVGNVKTTWLTGEAYSAALRKEFIKSHLVIFEWSFEHKGASQTWMAFHRVETLLSTYSFTAKYRAKFYRLAGDWILQQKPTQKNLLLAESFFLKSLDHSDSRHSQRSLQK